MKNILILTIVGLFALTMKSNAGIYDNQTRSVQTTESYGALYGNSSGDFEGDANSGALYRSPALDDLGGRPGTGEGIGQATPVGDGIYVMTACCIIFGVITLGIERRKNNMSVEL